jgi:hypothetical protein
VSFDHFGVVYQGTTLTGLRQLASIFNYGDGFGAYKRGSATFNAVKNEDYYIQFEGYTLSDDETEGTLTFYIDPRPTGAVSDSGLRTAHQVPMPTRAAGLLVSLRAQLRTLESQTQGWELAAFSGETNLGFGLAFDALNRTISVRNGTAELVRTGQVYVPGSDYDLEVKVDLKARTWGAQMDGVWLAEDVPLPDDVPPGGLESFSLTPLHGADGQSIPAEVISGQVLRE